MPPQEPASIPLFSVEGRAIERLGPNDTREILEEVRAAIVSIRRAGSDAHSLPKTLD
jgi:hypothetical protein